MKESQLRQIIREELLREARLQPRFTVSGHFNDAIQLLTAMGVHYQGEGQKDKVKDTSDIVKDLRVVHKKFLAKFPLK